MQTKYKPGKNLTWSPQGWLLNAPKTQQNSANLNAPVKLSFTQISQSVQDTIRDANTVKEEITDSVEKQKLIDQIKLLRSAAAQFVSAGQAYNSSPTNSNETKMNDAEIIMGRCNNIVVELMEAHSKGTIGCSFEWIRSPKRRIYSSDCTAVLSRF